MIGKELVFFPFLYIKLLELGVEVALNHRSVVTHHKVNLLKFPLHDISTVCLHFICEVGCARGCGPVFAVAFYKCDVGNACFSVSVCASVELWGV